MTEAEQTPPPDDQPPPEENEISLMGILGWVLAVLAFFSVADIIQELNGYNNLQQSTPTPTKTVIILDEIPSHLLPTKPASVETATPTLERNPLPIEAEDSYGVEMIFIPAGRFVMGNDQGPSNEKPAHLVYLSDYFIDKYEVTWGLYKACVDAEVCEQIPFLLPENHPVSNISWEEARIFCEEWRDARLPTEAEWEKAARGTDARTYPWGNGFNSPKANFCDRNCLLPWSDDSMNDGYANMAPVGSYYSGVSMYGVYDMSGNVWEWVADWYSPTYYSSLLYYAYKPQGPETGFAHVVRGGAWNSTEDDLHTTRRKGLASDDLHYTVGFRCARDVEIESQ